MNKRQKIIITSTLLSGGLLTTQLVPFYYVYQFLGALTFFAYFLSLWSLWEGITKAKAIVLLILPTLFMLAVSSYYFLLPVNWFVRVPVALLFGLAFYSLLLSQNVFNVASIRTIPLYRAASTVNFLFTLITAYLLSNVILSFNMLFIFNGIAIFSLVLPLIIQVIWSIEMERVDSMIIWYSLVLAMVAAEIALALSFWPISKSMHSLIISTSLYITLGLTTHSMRDRLKRDFVWEYLSVGIIIFLVAFYTTSWAG